MALFNSTFTRTLSLSVSPYSDENEFKMFLNEVN